MKRITGCEYEVGSDIPILLMVDGVDSNNLNKSYPYERVIHAKWIAKSRQKFANTDIAAIDENGKPFIKMKLVKFTRYKCSHCNEISDDNSLYCPNCGANMDLEESNND